MADAEAESRSSSPNVLLLLASSTEAQEGKMMVGQTLPEIQRRVCDSHSSRRPRDGGGDVARARGGRSEMSMAAAECARVWYVVLGLHE